ncbi:hypothetical protein [Nocardioides halotolerans]|uniref:hypothetical protein n=1 Tax=Nocardioides halotolerans TaxID=433660 RepID=UPI000427ED8E|nr:hypothetical protein [Nocardioides halotolerans]
MSTPADAQSDEPEWFLEPFTHIRYVGNYEDYADLDYGYRAFLIFVHDGRAATARLPLILGGPGGKTWERLNAEIRHVLDLLAEMDHQTRLAFHRSINETMDFYFTLERLGLDSESRVKSSECNDQR